MSTRLLTPLISTVVDAELSAFRDDDEVLRCQRAYKNILAHVPGLAKCMAEFVDAGDLTDFWNKLQKVCCTLRSRWFAGVSHCCTSVYMRSSTDIDTCIYACTTTRIQSTCIYAGFLLYPCSILHICVIFVTHINYTAY